MLMREFRDGDLYRELRAGPTPPSGSEGVGGELGQCSTGPVAGKRWSGRRLLLDLVIPFLPKGYPDSVRLPSTQRKSSSLLCIIQAPPGSVPCTMIVFTLCLWQVTPDYTTFQIWDTCQALCSYVRGMLCQKALMVGIGVGSEAATPLGALFSFFMRDFIGMLGGIVFAYCHGTGLDSHAKQWRLFADCVNNVGLALELASPLLPHHFLLMACLGSIARSLCGVAAGATRAAMTQHFALSRNAADISAKEGSQETATTLMGMILGLLVTHAAADDPFYAWSAFAVLTVLHIYCNIRAVRGLCLCSLNRPRLDVLLREFMTSGAVLRPQEVAGRESLLVPSFQALGRHLHGLPIVDITMGASLSELVQSGSVSKALMEAVPPKAVSNPQQVLHLLHRRGRTLKVILHRRIGAEGLLLAYMHAAVAMEFFNGCSNALPVKGPASMEESDEWVNKHSAKFIVELQAMGWDLSQISLATDSWRAEWPAAYTAESRHMQ
eukprot:CAMPEP_0117697722 /NCGR_PEP_ID=MMETSP0804-20121206/29390_1 /TAXON_ID=1074897 /ORGANISM="Tetraselmis astigmatica, Strain CCMP880" /LENGTH=493 /DNA_ID=CAMNT_0005512011 /DNA_START=334 /DNA_END=1815 /DNA_ORIENTATION=-